MLSDFENPAVARINPTGTPPRNGDWYSYNYGNLDCVQTPPPGAILVAGVPPMPSRGHYAAMTVPQDWLGDVREFFRALGSKS